MQVNTSGRSRYHGKQSGFRQMGELATEACELPRWEDWSCLRSLAATHAEYRDFADATTWAERALACAPQHGREICQAELDLRRATLD